MDGTQETVAAKHKSNHKVHFSVKFGISLIVALFFALLLTAAFLKLDTLCTAYTALHKQVQQMQNDIQQMNKLLEQKYGSRTSQR